MDTADELLLIKIGTKSPPQEIIIRSDFERRSRVLFAFQENDEVSIRKLDSAWEIEIETCDIGGEGRLRFLDDDELIINSNSNQSLPLFYKILFHKKDSNLNYAAFYRVAPLANASSDYDVMLDKISAWFEPAPYEESTSKIGTRIDNRFGQSFFHRSAFDNIYEKRNVIQAAISSVKDNPQTSLHRQIEKTFRPRKPNFHASVRNERKGELGEKQYACKTLIRVNTRENRYIKHMLSVSTSRLEELIAWTTRWRKRLETHIVREEEKIRRISKEKGKTTNLERSRDRHKKEFENSGNVLSSLHQIHALSLDALACYPLLECDASLERPMVQLSQSALDIERFLFNPLHRNYYAAPFVFNMMHGAPIKPTSQLFELYSLSIILDALFDMGFSLQDDDEYQQRSMNHEELLLSMGEYQVALAYEKTAADLFDESTEASIISINSKHVSPDFYLTLLEDGKPKCMLIIDSKCRRFNEVVRGAKKSGERLNDTIRDYLSLRYLAGDDQTSIASKEVWLLAPEKTADSFSSPLGIFSIKPLRIDGVEDAFKFDLELFLSSLMC